MPLADEVTAVGLAVVIAVWTSVADSYVDSTRQVDAPGMAMVVLGCLMLAARRRWPVPTFGVVTTLASGYLWLGYPYGPVLVTVLIAVYAVARNMPLRVGVVAVALGLVVLTSHLLSPYATTLGWVSLGPASAWVVVPFAVGVSVRTVRMAAARERAEQVRHHVDAERLRMSRDVHDVVGHGLAAINMQASLGLRSVSRHPRRAEEALAAIKSSSAAALQELRAVLARLDDGGEASRRPGPGLADVTELVQRLERASMVVTVRGPVDADLPPAADLAAYRVIQEGLTNALRHGSGNRAEVSITTDDTNLVVTITNPVGPVAERAASDGSGRGISGMRDRLEAIGGTLDVDRHAARFEVRAVIPRRADA